MAFFLFGILPVVFSLWVPSPTAYFAAVVEDRLKVEFEGPYEAVGLGLSRAVIQILLQFFVLFLAGNDSSQD